MQKFDDGKGKSWGLCWTYATAKQVRIETGWDISKVLKDQTTIMQLLDDPLLLAEILIILCRQQCKDRDISQDDFEQLLTADVLESAAIPFQEALIDFFPMSHRAVIRAMMSKAQSSMAKMSTELSDRIGEMNLDAKAKQEADRVMNEIQAKISTA